MSSQATIVTDEEMLKQEGLRHVVDSMPGITRRKHGTGFSYRDASGATIVDPQERERIRALVIPPAWTDVWICPYPNGHLQATGFDDRGRKQYLYHPRWREVRESAKFDRLIEFADALPGIRARVARDMSLRGLPREKVLATVVQLLELTLIRVGSAEYARDNDSYGLTTMRKKHIDLNGSDVRFRFTGKSGKSWDLTITDRRIANVVRRCSDLPGYELFKYEDDSGTLVDVTSSDVNAYLREISGTEFTAKDFRTWAGTVLAAMEMDALPAADSATEAKHQVVQVIDSVAQQLGNTPAICR